MAYILPGELYSVLTYKAHKLIELGRIMTV